MNHSHKLRWQALIPLITPLFTLFSNTQKSDQIIVQTDEQTQTTTLSFQPFKQKMSASTGEAIEITLNQPITITQKTASPKFQGKAICKLKVIITNHTKQTINWCEKITVTLQKKGKKQPYAQIDSRLISVKIAPEAQQEVQINEAFFSIDKQPISYKTFREKVIPHLKNTKLQLATLSDYFRHKKKSIFTGINLDPKKIFLDKQKKEPSTPVNPPKKQTKSYLYFFLALALFIGSLVVILLLIPENGAETTDEIDIEEEEEEEDDR